MFDIRIEEVNYYANIGEFPTVKAEVLVRDEDNFMTPVIKRTWVFDVISYANKDSGVGPFELIIEELVKRMWTALHRPVSKEWAVRIDMYLPICVNSYAKSYMNNLFTKYLKHERFRDNYARFLCNSRFGLSIEPEVPNRDICTLYPEPSEYVDTDTRVINDKRLRRFLEAEAIIRDYNKERAKAKEKIKEYERMQIEDVIFNDPATIVFWRDGSKTVVKAQDEPYDKEKGLAMAIAKKVYGNEGNYYNEFKKFIKDEPKEDNKNE